MKNIRFVVANGVTGDIKFDAVLTAKEAQALADTVSKDAILNVRHIASDRVQQQVGNGRRIDVPVCSADYPAYVVEVYVSH
jgi:hypothetical protein